MVLERFEVNWTADEIRATNKGLEAYLQHLRDSPLSPPRPSPRRSQERSQVPLDPTTVHGGEPIQFLGIVGEISQNSQALVSVSRHRLVRWTPQAQPFPVGTVGDLECGAATVIPKTRRFVISVPGKTPSLRLWDLPTEGPPIPSLSVPTSVPSNALTANETLLWSAGGPQISAFDFPSLQLLHQWTAHGSGVSTVTAGSQWEGGEGVVSGGWDGEVKVWDSRGPTERLPLRGHSRPVTGIALRGYTVVSCSADSSCLVWDIRSPRVPSHRWVPDGKSVVSLKMAPDRPVVAVTTLQGLWLWELPGPYNLSGSYECLTSGKTVCPTVAWEESGKVLFAGNLQGLLSAFPSLPF